MASLLRLMIDQMVSSFFEQLHLLQPGHDLLVGPVESTVEIANHRIVSFLPLMLLLFSSLF